jgi:hypothetical protein
MANIYTLPRDPYSLTPNNIDASNAPINIWRVVPNNEGFHSFATNDLLSLNYSLHTRKVRIGIFWMLVFLDTVVLSILLCFVL